jgi:hypothetical protein
LKGRSLSRLFSAAVAVAVAWVILVLSSSGVAWADDDDPDAVGASPPRDVAILIQPSAAVLPPLPADFQRIEHGWLLLEFPSSVRDRADALVREADDFRARLSEELGEAPLDHARVRIARTPDQMTELAPEGAPPPSYAAGVAYPSIGVALLALQAPGTWEAPDLLELLRHELTHIALADAVAGHHVPRWFNEGLAIYESHEAPWSRRAALGEASFSKRLLPFAEIDQGFPLDSYAVNVAYAESASVVGFLLRDSDRARFGSLVDRVRAGAAFERALEDAYGIDLRKLEYEWREEVSRHFSIIPVLTGGGLLWLVISVLAAVAWANRRKRAKAKLAQWAREEAEMEAALVATAVAGEPQPILAAPPAEDALPPGPTPGIPVVEHQGRWYTVH